MTIDEQFCAWIDPRSSLQPPLLIVGAGLSFGLAPNAQQLAKDTSERKDEIESALGIPAGPAISTNDDDLYVWADHCLTALKSVHALDEMPAKRCLASAMGLMTDKRFLAQAGVGPRGTTPRHRVLARLARENRIRAISKDGEVAMLSWAREMRAGGADPTVGSLKLRKPEQRAPLPQPLRPQVQSPVGAGN